MASDNVPRASIEIGYEPKPTGNAVRTSQKTTKVDRVPPKKSAKGVASTEDI